MRPWLAFALLVLLAGCTVSVSTEPPPAVPPLTEGTPEQQKEVLKVAKAIVHTLDRGEFDAAWEQSSNQFKTMAAKPVFVTMMTSTRGRLGKPAPRSTSRLGFGEQVDFNGPRGEYAIVEVDTTFGKRLIVEKVVLVREAGQWKLVGYFMRTTSNFQLLGEDPAAQLKP
jgi:hypothetical protein